MREVGCVFIWVECNFLYTGFFTFRRAFRGEFPFYR
nr:MAG TPA: hypothetical protein [Caudoviricetes sp.]